MRNNLISQAHKNKGKKRSIASASSVDQGASIDDAMTCVEKAGESGIDYLEHYAFSTQATLFALSHWQKHLGSDIAKGSAGILFDYFIDTTLASVHHTIFLSTDWRAGTVGTHGFPVHVQLGCITDCQALAEEFKIVGQALGRKDDRKKLLEIDTGADRSFNHELRLRTLLKWLHGKVTEEALSLFWSIIFARSVIIDTSTALLSSSNDPLDQPELIGPQGKRLKVSQAKKTRVAKIAAKGEIFKSCRAVLRGMEMLGKGNAGSDADALGKGSANKWMEPLAFQYLHCLRDVFYYQNILWPVFSISRDATRLSKKDTLFAAIYNHWLRKAAWCPPMVFCLLQTSRVREGGVYMWLWWCIFCTHR